MYHNKYCKKNKSYACVRVPSILKFIRQKKLKASETNTIKNLLNLNTWHKIKIITYDVNQCYNTQSQITWLHVNTTLILRIQYLSNDFFLSQHLWNVNYFIAEKPLRYKGLISAICVARLIKVEASMRRYNLNTSVPHRHITPLTLDTLVVNCRIGHVGCEEVTQHALNRSWMNLLQRNQ